MNIRNIMARATSAVELMYDKNAVVKRYVPYEKPSGADGMRWEDIHSDVPCRLSSTTLNNTVQGDVNVIQYDEKLFLSSSYDILAGDEVIVDGVKFDSAKEPKVYVSHQEVLLIRKGYA